MTAEDSVRRLTHHINLVIQRYIEDEDTLFKLEEVFNNAAKDCAQCIFDIDTCRGENEEEDRDDEIEF